MSPMRSLAACLVPSRAKERQAGLLRRRLVNGYRIAVCAARWTLVPAFRSSCSLPAAIFTNFGKTRAPANYESSAAVRSEVPGDHSRQIAQGLQIGGTGGAPLTR